MDPTWQEVQALGSDASKFCRDEIEAAIVNAKCYVEESCFSEPCLYTDALKYLTVHILIAGSQPGGAPSGPILSRKLGNARVQYAQPLQTGRTVPIFYRGSKYGLLAWGIMEMQACTVLPFTAC